jgi:hypothetical protein
LDQLPGFCMIIEDGQTKKIPSLAVHPHVSKAFGAA